MGKTRLTPHRPEPSLQYVIVEIDTDDGITGVGEACTDIGFFGEPVEEVQSAIDLYLGPKLLGKDPFDDSRRHGAPVCRMGEARGRQSGLHAEGSDPAVPHVRAPRRSPKPPAWSA